MVDDARLQVRQRARHVLAIQQVDILAPPASDVGAALGEELDHMAADETTRAGHEHPTHGREPYCFW
jgi:hypothetical protein